MAMVGQITGCKNCGTHSGNPSPMDRAVLQAMVVSPFEAPAAGNYSLPRAQAPSNGHSV